MSYLHHFSFGHGLGDNANAVQLFQLWLRRGDRFQVKVGSDKRWLWESCGFETCDRAPNDHPWWEPQPADPTRLACPWNGGKTGHNLHHPYPLHRLGATDDPALWDEFLTVKLDLSPHVGEQARERIDRLIRDLPWPLAVLHTRGRTATERKDFPRNLEADTLAELAARGYVALVDLDSTPWYSPDPNVLVMCAATVEELVWLIHRADVVVGIDSGVYHLARLTQTPRLGVWFGIPAWHASVPDPLTLNLVLPHPWNEVRREAFNMFEVMEHTAEGIAEAAGYLTACQTQSSPDP